MSVHHDERAAALVAHDVEHSLLSGPAAMPLPGVLRGRGVTGVVPKAGQIEVSGELAAGALNSSRVVPAETFLVPISKYIEDNLEHLTCEWTEFARTRLPAAETMDAKALQNGAAAILLAIANDMRSAQSDAQQLAKSQGDRPQNAPKVTSTAQEHAAQRLNAGFSLDQLVSEYRALRATVVRGFTESSQLRERSEVVDALIRFDEAMDQSLTEAVSWFNDGVERSRDILVGVLAHDLRAPLSAAAAAVEVVGMAGDETSTRQRAADTARRNLQRMANMIDVLLDFARTRLGRALPISPGPVSLEEVCTEIVQSFETSNPNVELRLQCDGEVTGDWDYERIRQLLTNLTRNAIEHGAPNAPVTITARAEDDAAVLAVHNVGPVIPEENRHSIFEPLIRATAEPKHNGSSRESMGLGLYIVRRIAEAHGGSAEVRSDEKSGTTFAVRLPKREAGLSSDSANRQQVG